MVKQINFYQFRLTHEEFNEISVDWYHTTGSIVINKDGYTKSVPIKIKDTEDLAIYIRKNIIKY